MRITFWKALPVLIGGACAVALLWHGGAWAIVRGSTALHDLQAAAAPVLAQLPPALMPSVFGICGVLLGCAWGGVIDREEPPLLSPAALALVLAVPLAGLLLSPQWVCVAALFGGTIPGMPLAGVMRMQRKAKPREPARAQAPASWRPTAN